MNVIKLWWGRWEALCKAHPKGVLLVVSVIALSAFVIVPLRQTLVPQWVVWSAVAYILVTGPFAAWATFRRERRLRAEWDAEQSESTEAM